MRKKVNSLAHLLSTIKSLQYFLLRYVLKWFFGSVRFVQLLHGRFSLEVSSEDDTRSHVMSPIHDFDAVSPPHLELKLISVEA